MSDVLNPDLGEYTATLTGSGVISFDLGEYPLALTPLAAFDLGGYLSTIQAGGVLGRFDLGEYGRTILEYGVIGQFDLGEYVRVATEYNVLPAFDLGEYTRLWHEYNVLPEFDLGEYASITQAGGVLGQFDLGEYSYIWAYPPVGASLAEADLFPEMRGEQWDVIHKPEFVSKVQHSESGRELRSAYRVNPLWYITMTYDIFKDTATNVDFALDFAIQRILGFFMKHLGSFGNFLFTNPRDHIVTAEVFGSGDGVTKSFQLVRAYGAGGFTFTENVMNVKTLADVLINGASVNGAVNGSTVIDNPCVVDQYGMATFRDAPAGGASLAWSGEFYYRCRFQDDLLDFTNFMSRFWSGGLTLVGSLDNRI